MKSQTVGASRSSNSATTDSPVAGNDSRMRRGFTASAGAAHSEPRTKQRRVCREGRIDADDSTRGPKPVEGELVLLSAALTVQPEAREGAAAHHRSMKRKTPRFIVAVVDFYAGNDLDRAPLDYLQNRLGEVWRSTDGEYLLDFLTGSA